MKAGTLLFAWILISAFFDMKTTSILDSGRMFGDAGGFVFRKSQAASVYNSMKIWY